MKGVFLDSESVDNGDIDFDALRATLPDWTFHSYTSPEDTLERVRGADIVVSNKVVLGRDVLEAAPELKLVCVAATGTNNVDLEAARELGIVVSNVVNYGTPSVVQHVFSLMLALTTKLFSYRDAVLAGDWGKSRQFCMLDYPIRELNGKTLGIVGYGELGSGVARVAECFGMEILIAQRPGGPAAEGRLPLDDMLPRVDVLTLHCPLTDQTRNLIGAKELSLMKPDALLINAARGGIVDEAALAQALRDGVIGGAGVDTITQEPPVNGNVLLDASIPNLIVTPHIAWAGRNSRQRMTDIVTANIKAFLDGKPANRVA